MPTTSQRLMLLDTPSLYFRAFHGVPKSVVSPDGMPVNAVRGLIDVIARLVTANRPGRIVACFDEDWRPAFRVAAVPSYKAHRVGADGGDETPPLLAPQLPVINDVLDAVGIARVGAAGFEADDVIGTLATRHDGPVDVVTGDRDLFQLIDDSRGVRVLYSVEKFAVIDEAEVSRRYSIPGRVYGDFAVLRGDPSDGLPGVAGIGPKAASALMERFGSLSGVLQAVDSGSQDGFPAGALRRLSAARDYIEAATGAVRVVTDIDLPPFDDRLPAEPAHPAEFVELSGRFGLDSSCERLLSALRAAAGPM